MAQYKADPTHKKPSKHPMIEKDRSKLQSAQERRHLGPNPLTWLRIYLEIPFRPRRYPTGL